MDYANIYAALVKNAKARGLNKSKVEGYFETHHIIPRCMGGSDGKSNLVMFTGREHYIAHMLLWKAYPEEVSLMRAAHMMSSRWQSSTGVKTTSRLYAQLRLEYAVAVSEQVAGEGNPFYGKKHSEEALQSIRNSKLPYYVGQRLIHWRANNDRYMRQVLRPISVPKPFFPSKVDEFKAFRFKGALEDWLAFHCYKDFWVRSGKTSNKDFARKINRVTAGTFTSSYFKTMCERFASGWEPEGCSDFIVKALNTPCDDYILLRKSQLEKTVEEVEAEYVAEWMNTRVIKRIIIQATINSLGLKVHPNTSVAKLSLLDVAEALILWRSGNMKQKDIAQLYGVARNSLSVALSGADSWKVLKDNIEMIESIVYTGA
ncbi:NUMOD3 domain-containing DNA-binding protein [Pseudomonas putida]|uniref:HNH nuclease domain-containing protein n=1 Tax=Pseudomonas putida TaxID=303 RepID=A0A1L5PIY4_PSEPU|nr:NUMOD3 domain-containing DNA-binding protein [Pseudomonas putida]APO80189.1 hypothetical protein BL240_01240 [Pseudomonas putida]